MGGPCVPTNCLVPCSASDLPALTNAHPQVNTLFTCTDIQSQLQWQLLLQLWLSRVKYEVSNATWQFELGVVGDRACPHLSNGENRNGKFSFFVWLFVPHVPKLLFLVTKSGPE